MPKPSGNLAFEKPFQCSPFVKWAGGKTQLVDRLKFPKDFGSYYEPFLGGGAVFFHIATEIHPKTFPAHLSDLNPDLIGSYIVIRDKVEELVESLNVIQKEWRELPRSKKSEYYYKTRDSPPAEKDAVARAAWFIFLNKTAYNGLYRVNRKGIFNVPYGDYPNATLCVPENLRKISMLLSRSGTEIKVQGYSSAVTKCRKGDFVYFDPPYHPVAKSGFTDYTKESFGESDQEKLAILFTHLTRKGCYVLLSNSDSELVRRLYENSESAIIEQLTAFRMINSVGSKRTGASELTIRNYS